MLQCLLEMLKVLATQEQLARIHNHADRRTAWREGRQQNLGEGRSAVAGAGEMQLGQGTWKRRPGKGHSHVLSLGKSIHVGSTGGVRHNPCRCLATVPATTTPATVFCDFDGTITEVDTFDLVMGEVYGSFWSTLKQDLLSFRLTLREAMDRLGQVLEAEHLAAMAERMVSFPPRPGFLPFLDAMEAAGIPVVVVSGGFLPLVQPVLAPFHHRLHAVIAGTLTPQPTGYRLHSPFASDQELVAKAAVVAHYNRGRSVVIGDGITDRQMARVGDLVFARDWLANLMEQQRIPFHPWGDFTDVLQVMAAQGLLG